LSGFFAVFFANSAWEISPTLYSANDGVQREAMLLILVTTALAQQLPLFAFLSLSESFVPPGQRSDSEG